MAKYNLRFLTFLPLTSKGSSMASLANFVAVALAAIATAADSLLSSQPGLLKKIANV